MTENTRGSYTDLIQGWAVIKQKIETKKKKEEDEPKDRKKRNPHASINNDIAFNKPL